MSVPAAPEDLAPRYSTTRVRREKANSSYHCSRTARTARTATKVIPRTYSSSALGSDAACASLVDGALTSLLSRKQKRASSTQAASSVTESDSFPNKKQKDKASYTSLRHPPRAKPPSHVPSSSQVSGVASVSHHSDTDSSFSRQKQFQPVEGKAAYQSLRHPPRATPSVSDNSSSIISRQQQFEQVEHKAAYTSLRHPPRVTRHVRSSSTGARPSTDRMSEPENRADSRALVHLPSRRMQDSNYGHSYVNQWLVNTAHRAASSRRSNSISSSVQDDMAISYAPPVNFGTTTICETNNNPWQKKSSTGFRRTVSIASPFARSNSSGPPRAPSSQGGPLPSPLLGSFPRPGSRTALPLVKHNRNASANASDSSAIHLQDASNRNQLRQALASPQKFDEAVQLGFTPSQSVPSLQQPKTPSISQVNPESIPMPSVSPEILPEVQPIQGDEITSIQVPDPRKTSLDVQCFLRDEQCSVFDETAASPGETDTSSINEVDSPVTPHLPEDTFPAGTVSIQSSSDMTPTISTLPTPNNPYGRHPRDFTNNQAFNSREMTLRMTLTRADLRAKDPKLDWHKKKKDGLDPMALQSLNLTDDTSGQNGAFAVQTKKRPLMKRVLRRVTGSKQA